MCWLIERATMHEKIDFLKYNNVAVLGFEFA